MSSYSFEMIGSWPHVAMVVVLVWPHFPSLRYMLCLSRSWCPHTPVFTTMCCIYYCWTDSRSNNFPSSKRRVDLKLWELDIGERGQLEVKDEKENMPLVDMVAIVAQVCGAVCQLYLRHWNTTLAAWKLCGHQAYVDMYYQVLYIVDTWYWLREGMVNIELSFFRH